MQTTRKGGLLGETVTFPVDHGQWDEGTVTAELPDGEILVEGDDGTRWKGYEHQVVVERR